MNILKLNKWFNILIRKKSTPLDILRNNILDVDVESLSAIFLQKNSGSTINVIINDVQLYIIKLDECIRSIDKATPLINPPAISNAKQISVAEFFISVEGTYLLPILYLPVLQTKALELIDKYETVDANKNTNHNAHIIFTYTTLVMSNLNQIFIALNAINKQ